jgi:hypothetical protein
VNCLLCRTSNALFVPRLQPAISLHRSRECCADEARRQGRLGHSDHWGMARARTARYIMLRDTARRRSFCLVVPELIRSAYIKLNERVLLQRPFEFLTLSESCGLARHYVPPPGHAYRAIRGRRFARGRRPRSNRIWMESSMTRRRGLILSIVTAGCWIILLAIVFNSVFAASKLTKQIRSKDRQSAQG